MRGGGGSCDCRCKIDREAVSFTCSMGSFALRKWWWWGSLPIEIARKKGSRVGSVVTLRSALLHYSPHVDQSTFISSPSAVAIDRLPNRRATRHCGTTPHMTHRERGGVDRAKNRGRLRPTSPLLYKREAKQVPETLATGYSSITVTDTSPRMRLHLAYLV